METVLRSADGAPVVPSELLDTSGRLVFFPVRHHSPACARLLREFILAERPAAVLIEGPSDFNDRLSELLLPHQLPIAIYSYVHLCDGARRGAFYPFCEYSPEWQAVKAGTAVGSDVKFIDLPWGDLAALGDEPQNRYSDAELRFGRYVKTVCQRLGVEDFDSAWDCMIEQDGQLSLTEYFERCHHYCFQTRTMQEQISPADQRREACMARFVQEALDQHPEGRVLVVTGGFHSLAVLQRIQAGDFGAAPIEENAAAIQDRGIAITPYSYERLDSLRGYEAGLPNPGFYHAVWQDRAQVTRKQNPVALHHGLLIKVIDRLRERGQTCSTADFIAVETMARGLAQLRGRADVWRNDLVDAITSALIKEEVDDRHRSPFLAAVYDVLRGTERGHLAAGAVLPPLVSDIRDQLRRLNLEPTVTARIEDLQLTDPTATDKSRVLHRLRLLSISGFQLTGGTDLATREDLSRMFETWSLRWHPEYEAACVEAARYGASLHEATNARLLERARGLERDAEKAALLLLDAAQAGSELPLPLVHELGQLIASDNQFLTVTAALGHLLFLFRFDEVLGTAGTLSIGQLLTATFARSAWLLEQLGQVTGQERKMLAAMRTLLEVFERVGAELVLDREEFVGILSRVQADRLQSAAMRGAAAGALANLGAIDAERVRKDLQLFADPTHLGDYLAGLFSLARELAQRDPELLSSIDAMLVGWTADEFVAALPSLRLAFTYFTPREKHHLLTTLFKSLGITESAPLARLEVDPEVAAQALALEGRVFEIIQRFGLRGAS